MVPPRRPRLIPRSSRRRSSQAPADARLSPQGHGRIGLLTAGIPAHPRSGRKRHDRPVTPELAVRVLSLPLQDSPANAGVSRRRARSARPRDRAPGWGQPCPAKRKTAALRRFHGASRTRTGDLLGAIQALSQLSYSPVPGQCSPARGHGPAVSLPREPAASGRASRCPVDRRRRRLRPRSPACRAGRTRRR